MPSEARQKKIMEKLNRAQNAQFWGLKTPPPRIRTWEMSKDLNLTDCVRPGS